MTINLRDSLRVRNTNVIRLYPQQRAILLMRIVDSEITPSLSALPQQPEIGERCREWTRYAADGPVAKVGENVVQDRKKEKCIWGEKVRQEHSVD